MTSNLGNQLWEGNRTGTREEITRLLQSHFRPEFLNRIDEVVAFHQLGKDRMAQII
jgi:ATP-dependent Clp protease ATP-binding subunit ClpB